MISASTGSTWTGSNSRRGNLQLHMERRSGQAVDERPRLVLRATLRQPRPLDPGDYADHAAHSVSAHDQATAFDAGNDAAPAEDEGDAGAVQERQDAPPTRADEAVQGSRRQPARLPGPNLPPTAHLHCAVLCLAQRAGRHAGGALSTCRRTSMRACPSATERRRSSKHFSGWTWEHWSRRTRRATPSSCPWWWEGARGSCRRPPRLPPSTRNSSPPSACCNG